MFKYLLKVFTSKALFKHYALAIALTFGIIVVIRFVLEDFTLHGQEITVPDLRGLSVEESKGLLEGRNLRFVIADSSYVKGKAPNIILDQRPAPNFKVKRNRTIYLEKNSSIPPKIALPNLLDLTLRMARNQIEVLGLKEDKLEYRPDIAVDVILGVKYEGEKIKPGTKLIRGSKISFVVGAGQGNQKTPVPNLFGLSLEEANEELLDHSLNVGNIIFDSTVIDTPNARIFQQRPLDTLMGEKQVKLRLGSFVDLWITQEIQLDSLFMSDSLALDTLQNGSN